MLLKIPSYIPMHPLLYQNIEKEILSYTKNVEKKILLWAAPPVICPVSPGQDSAGIQTQDIPLLRRKLCKNRGTHSDKLVVIILLKMVKC